MDTEHAIFIATAAVAFGIALLAVITQWLKADEIAADVEVDVRTNLNEMRAVDNGTAKPTATPQIVTARLEVEAGDTLGAAPAKLADDETALSRLFFGWGIAGMITGIALGAVMWGAVGALLGGVVLTALSVGTVVVGVLAVDRAREQAAKERQARAGDAAAQAAQAYARVR
ncbi:MAG TPA: hypothetical protein VF331_00350 [Polyangiales bacterium]